MCFISVAIDDSDDEFVQLVISQSEQRHNKTTIYIHGKGDEKTMVIFFRWMYLYNESIMVNQNYVKYCCSFYLDPDGARIVQVFHLIHLGHNNMILIGLLL